MLNQIHHKDCLDVLKELESGSVDLFLQDTPFEVTKNDWDIKPEFKIMWPEWLRVGKQNCAFVFFATQPFASELIMSMPDLFRYDVIWQKNNGTGHLNSSNMPLRSHESVLVFYRNLPTYNPIKTTGHRRKVSLAKHKIGSKKTTNYGDHGLTDYDSTERFPTSVVYFPTDKQTSAVHPTQKPLDLIRYFIKTYSNVNDLVFDGYGGSGTTALACDVENRKFIVCEKKLSIFQDAVNRLKNHTNQIKADFETIT